MVRYQGDTNIVREFFEREYRQNPQPSTFVEVNKFWQNFSLDTYVQPRVNDFLETVERLPDVRLTGYRQQLGATPVYYESESSAGYYRRLFVRDQRLRPDPQLLKRPAPTPTTNCCCRRPSSAGSTSPRAPAAGSPTTATPPARAPPPTNSAAASSTPAPRSPSKPPAFGRGRRATSSRWMACATSSSPRSITSMCPSPNYHGTNDLPQFDYELTSLRLLPD